LIEKRIKKMEMDMKELEELAKDTGSPSGS
jgi:hypothetical protein